MIIYALVARASTDVVLVEYSQPGVSGNFSTVTNTLLKGLTLQDGARKTFIYDRGTVDIEARQRSDSDHVNGSYYYFVSQDKGMLYICLSDDVGKQRKIFSFLEEIKKKFTKKYSDKQIQNANAYAMDKAFSSSLSSIMHHYNTDPNAGNLTTGEVVNSMVEETKDVMSANIDKVLSRGDQIDLVVERADAMEIDSKQFVKKSTALKRTVNAQDWQIKMGIAAVAAFACYLLLVHTCGLFLGRCM